MSFPETEINFISFLSWEVTTVSAAAFVLPPLQDQWCQSSHTQNITAASTTSDQQWSVCQAEQGFHQYAEAGRPLHCLGVSSTSQTHYV